MLGSGRMWVAQAALDNPNAVKMSMRGQGLPTEALLKRYLPSVSSQQDNLCHICLLVTLMLERHDSLEDANMLCLMPFEHCLLLFLVQSCSPAKQRTFVHLIAKASRLACLLTKTLLAPALV